MYYLPVLLAFPLRINLEIKEIHKTIQENGRVKQLKHGLILSPIVCTDPKFSCCCWWFWRKKDKQEDHFGLSRNHTAVLRYGLRMCSIMR